ncbi:MAG: hydroxyacid dehydrogenase [Dehalococcoidia bacterium]|nr:hydroxyacid dehydrogenase [Dehalococcoidia bacterium]
MPALRWIGRCGRPASSSRLPRTWSCSSTGTIISASCGASSFASQTTAWNRCRETGARFGPDAQRSRQRSTQPPGFNLPQAVHWLISAVGEQTHMATLGQKRTPDSATSDVAQQPKVVVVDVAGTFGAAGERDILAQAGCRIVTVTSSDDEAVLEEARDADALIGQHHVSRQFLGALTRCKIITVGGIGMNRFQDVDFATEQGIIVTNVPDVFVDEVANHSVALLLACIRWLVPAAQRVREGGWGGSDRGMIHRMTGNTLGLLSFGNIARGVAQRMAGFALREIIAYDPYVDPEVFAAHGVRSVPMAQVFQDADFISCHVPLLPDTHHLIGAPEFGLVKANAIFINTSRGQVVDEDALIAALQDGRLLAAGLDVTEQEPLPPDSPLRKMPNVVVTPHMASTSDWAALERRRRLALEVAAVLTGHRPRGAVNPQVLARLKLK